MGKIRAQTVKKDRFWLSVLSSLLLSPPQFTCPCGALASIFIYMKDV
jgi:hypothetical protein